MISRIPRDLKSHHTAAVKVNLWEDIRTCITFRFAESSLSPLWAQHFCSRWLPINSRRNPPDISSDWSSATGMAHSQGAKFLPTSKSDVGNPASAECGKESSQAHNGSTGAPASSRSKNAVALNALPTPTPTPASATSASTPSTTTPRQPTLNTQLADLSIRESDSPLTPTPASASSSPFYSSPSPTFSPVLSHKRAAFLSKHMRSKSYQFPGAPTSPLNTSMASSSRPCAPPLFRTTSLPTVPGYASPDRRYPSPTKSYTGWQNSPLPSSSGNTLQNYRLRDRSPSRQLSSPSSSPTPGCSPFFSSHTTVPPNQVIPPPSWANESHPTHSPHLYSPSMASSSCPSTPTSLRSRSPSISSLETIPDSPDAEAEELEAEKLAYEERQKATEMKRSNSSPSSEKTLRRRSHVGLDGLGGTGGGSGGMDKRKRWSVCGGEKRADLELETIWEDSVVAVQSPPQQSLVSYELGSGFGEGEMI